MSISQAESAEGQDDATAEIEAGSDESPAAAFADASFLSLLNRAEACVEELGGGFTHSLQGLHALSGRLLEGRFHLAVLGQVKRGKSTLLNALLGEPLLPTSVIPVTAIPTFIRPGTSRRVRVSYLADKPPSEKGFQGDETDLTGFLSNFVSEASNPNNRLGVLFVEVFYQASILREGLVLIDTPGIGSTFRHNTEATLNFLPQCDAALFVVSVDPPMTEVEVEFLKEVRTKVPRLFFILNKTDYLSDTERGTALEFLKKVLHKEAGIADNPVFCVSSRLGLQAKHSRDNELWMESGLAEVERHLLDFLVSEKAAALRHAVGLKAMGILETVLMELSLTLRSLELPLADLERRLKIFEEKIREAEHQRQIARDILSGDLRRIKELLAERSQDLARDSQGYLEAVVQEALAKSGPNIEMRPAKEALATGIPVFFERRLGEFERDFGKRVSEILQIRQKQADELIDSVRRNASELFEIPYSAPRSDQAFELVRKPYWVTHKWEATLNPIPTELSDRLLPAVVRRPRIAKRVAAQVKSLVTVNVENLRWPLLQSIEDAFRRFGSSLDDCLLETIEATQGALRRTISRRQKESEATACEVERTEGLVARLREIVEQIGFYAN